MYVTTGGFPAYIEMLDVSTRKTCHGCVIDLEVLVHGTLGKQQVLGRLSID